MPSLDWIDRAGRSLLRLSLAVVFVWFGLPKLADLCPLAGFISRSVPFLPATPFRLTLGCWEVAIGVCLVVPTWTRLGLWLLLFHLPGTFLPLVVIPGECFTRFPIGLTLEGQYIIKNLVLASAALIVAVQCRGPAIQVPTAALLPVAVPIMPAMRPAMARGAAPRGLRNADQCGSERKRERSADPRKSALRGSRPKAAAR